MTASSYILSMRKAIRPNLKQKEDAMKDFNLAFEQFLKAAQAKVNEVYCSGSNILTTEEGSKRIRVVSNYYGKSVYCFVDKATGDILKAASWSVPAKGKRGSIYDPDHGASAVNEYGANYVR